MKTGLAVRVKRGARFKRLGASGFGPHPRAGDRSRRRSTSPSHKTINIRRSRIIVGAGTPRGGRVVIRFGPSGIPLSCKGRTLRDGIEDIHNLGLTAMEVQLVRVNLNERYAGDEDVGRTPREILGELTVQIGRKEDRKEVLISSLDEKIEKGDVLYSLASGIAGDYQELQQLGDLARELDIELSLHTPYYMDLADADGLAQKSVQSVVWGGMLAEAMGSPIVVTHLGMFGELAPKEAMTRIAKNLRLIKRPEDFDDVLSKLEKVSDGGHIHSHFSGVEHADGNELRYTPIKKGDLRFEPLAECLLDEDYDLTIVSSSPLLEHDAMYMKVILERVLAKRLIRPPKPPRGISSIT